MVAGHDLRCGREIARHRHGQSEIPTEMNDHRERVYSPAARVGRGKLAKAMVQVMVKATVKVRVRVMLKMMVKVMVTMTTLVIGGDVDARWETREVRLWVRGGRGAGRSVKAC